MIRNLHIIRKKIESIPNALLRFSKGADRQTMHVCTSINTDHFMNCIVLGDIGDTKLLNSDVTLIQKNHNDYLYIAGRIDGEVDISTKIVSLRITKACWYTRKKNGSVVWLEEKYFYETPAVIELAS